VSGAESAIPALAVDCPSLGYPGKAALSNVRFTIRAGERVALLGGNGTGKTALLKTIVGLLNMPGSTIQIAGRTVTGSPARAVSAGVGLVFQNPDDQLFGATVREDALFGPQNQGHSPEESASRVARSLADLGIVELAERPIEALSFGERKRACLAGVLAMQPSLLLLDEPTAGLDPRGELAFVALLDRLTGEGRGTLLFATHAVDLVPLFAERVILLGGGRIVADGPPREVFRQTELLRAAHVRAPWVAELWMSLASRDAARDQPLPLTLGEASACLRARD
jgi:cobalt/nickel transport system ATP-binding protein